MVESTNSHDEQNQFAVSLLTPWIKGSMDCSDNFLRIDMPNTVFFGLIPAGKEKDSTPLQGVTNVYTSNSYKLGAIILGALIALAGFEMFGNSPIGGLIVVLIGIAVLGGGIKTQFSYERAGIIKTINVPFFEADKVKQFEQRVIDQLSGYQDDRNVRMQTEKSMQQSKVNTDAIVNAVKDNHSQAENDENAATNQQPQPKPFKQAAPSSTTTTTNNTVTKKAPNFCPNCGTKVVPGSKFCTHCGYKLV